MSIVLDNFWAHQQVLPIQNGYHGLAFPSTRGTMQGGLVSLILFNVVVKNFIRIWLAMTVEDHRVAHNELGEAVGRCLRVFYTNYSMVGSRDLYWMKHSMNVLVGLFLRYGLADNVTKSRSMVCQPGALRSGMSAEAKALKFTGVRDSYCMILRQRISCPECGVELTAGSMTYHHRHMNGTEPAIYWNRFPFSQTEHHPQVYNVRFPRSTNHFPCPFPGCPGSSHRWNGLRSYVNR